MYMKILKGVNKTILTMIGEQPVFGNKDYRFMKHCLCLNIDDGKVIANGLTRAIIFLSNREMKEIYNINQYEYLYKNYFLVPEDFNEASLIDKVRDTLKKPIDDLYLVHPNAYTILTTTKCNARCFYCYENGVKHKRHMSKETATKVAKYILEQSTNDVSLHWFGGEPLFNQEIIDLITNYLKTNGKKYKSSFTSNGYLFSKEIAERAKNEWNTTNVQITLDGTEKVYNEAKNYIYKGDNPYKVVLNNIARLLNLGIQVSIRMNMDNYNSENIKELIKELYHRFGNHPKLNVYCWLIFEENGYVRTQEEKDAVYERLYEIEQLLKEFGYYKGSAFGEWVKQAQCMADNGNSILISPDGSIGTCEHLTDSHFFSHIDNPDIRNYDELFIWREYEPKLDICDNCPIYGECIRPSHCVEMSKCDSYIKEWNIRKYEQGLLNFYLRYKEKRKKDPEMLNENM